MSPKSPESPESTPTPIYIPYWAKLQANILDSNIIPHAATTEIFNRYLKDDPTWKETAYKEVVSIKQTFYLLVLESEGYPYLSIPNDQPQILKEI